jgi:uncharacterized RDD family membrane protein YckC
MDENNNNQTPTGDDMAQPQPEMQIPQPQAIMPEQPMQSQMQTQPAPETGVVYASFFERLIALIIDIVILAIAGAILGTVSAMASQLEQVMSMLATLMAWTYLVYMDVKQGGTIGKRVMGLRVQNMDTGANLELVPAILREIVGRFLSGLVLLLGYFWMLWDPKKQTWHDKLGNSVVVKVQK